MGALDRLLLAMLLMHHSRLHAPRVSVKCSRYHALRPAFADRLLMIADIETV